MCFYLLPRKTRVEVRVEALRGVGVQRDVEGVHALQHPQVFGGRTQPRFDHFAARQQAGPARGEMRRSRPRCLEEDLDGAAPALGHAVVDDRAWVVTAAGRRVARPVDGFKLVFEASRATLALVRRV